MATGKTLTWSVVHGTARVATATKGVAVLRRPTYVWEVQARRPPMRVFIGVCAISVVIPFASLSAKQTAGDRVRVSNCYPQFQRGRVKKRPFDACTSRRPR